MVGSAIVGSILGIGDEGDGCDGGWLSIKTGVVVSGEYVTVGVMSAILGLHEIITVAKLNKNNNFNGLIFYYS